MTFWIRQSLHYVQVLFLLTLLPNAFTATNSAQAVDGVPGVVRPGSGPVKVARPSDEPLPEPDFSSDSAAPEFVLPPLRTPEEESAPLSNQLQVFVRAFRIQGNTVLSPDELEAVTAPYVGRLVSTAELQALRRKLTLLLIEKGYITSGVILPDQKVIDGTIVLQVVEGVLADVRILGESRLKPAYIRDRIQVNDQSPLQLANLQERLQLLQLDPNIERLNAQLTPGTRLGESILMLDIEESRRFAWGLDINNYRSPSVGSIQGELFSSYRNITGFGDYSQVTLKKTEGLDEGEIGLSIPLRPRGPTLNIGYRRGESEVVESPFNEIDAESEFEEFSIGLSHRIVERLSRTLDLSVNLNKRRNETFLLGRPFSFSPGVDNGESKVTVIRLVGDWRERAENQVVAVRSILSKGIDALDATVNSGLPDGRFFTWVGQFQYARRFGENQNELIFRTDLQLAVDPLLPMEKFGVGGRYSVRGYRENELVRDSGWVSSIELRFPVLREIRKLGRVQLAVFADYGNAWNKDADTPHPRSLSSAGLGIRWNPRPGWHLELYGAIPFRELDHEEHDLQDSGIHFQDGYRDWN